jgi:hypothetical protein
MMLGARQAPPSASRAPAACLGRPKSRRAAAAAATAAGVAAAGPAATAAAINHNNGEDAFGALRRWVSAGGGALEGIRLSDACKLGPLTVRGPVATRDVAPGDVLFSVPLRLCITDSETAPQPAPYAGAPPNVRLAARLLAERRLGAASAFAPYIAARCEPRHRNLCCGDGWVADARWTTECAE